MTLKIDFQLDRAALYSWHGVLIAALRARGHLVRCKLVAGNAGNESVKMPAFFDLVRKLEAVAFKMDAPLVQKSDASDFAQSDFEGDAELAFNLSGQPSLSAQSYEILLNGERGYGSAFASLAGEHAPGISLMRDGVIVSQALPAINHKNLFADSWQSVVEHIMTLVCGVVDSTYLPSRCDSAPEGAATKIGFHSLPLFFAVQFAKKLRDRIRRRSAHEDHWQVGYRKISGPGVLQTHAWPGEAYSWLPDDGQRYYADPFIYSHAGKTYLFVEEYGYDDCKGILAVSSLNEDGTFSTPVSILERPYHLSYPLIFEQDGEIYMMPETCANKSLELYRAEEFPHKWVFERTLLEDVEIADVTPVEWNGATYLFANAREGFLRSWSALHIYKGASPLGPFERLQNGPALLDAASARPAGHMAVVDGKIVRVVQDGRGGYGAALLLTQVTKLDESHFEQSVEKVLLPDPSWGFTGVHTLNRADGFEVIDVRGWRKKNAKN